MENLDSAIKSGGMEQMSDEELKLSQDVIDNIVDNYKNLEESIVRQLSLSYKNQGTVTGTLREDIWLQLFEQIVPKKFVIEHSIFIIDSKRHVSKEIDLAIVDQNYTPYIFQYGRLKFIPIEAVAAVVECKSTTVDDQSLTNWVRAIKQLRTSQRSVVRMATNIVVDGVSYDERGPMPGKTTQSSTRPLRIFCGYKSRGKQALLEENFDFILTADEIDKHGRIDVWMNKEEDGVTLKYWFQELNHYGEEKEVDRAPDIYLDGKEGNKLDIRDYRIIRDGTEVSLMSFNLLLNQMLMLINNPILFPHRAYADMFNGKDEP